MGKSRKRSRSPRRSRRKYSYSQSDSKESYKYCKISRHRKHKQKRDKSKEMSSSSSNWSSSLSPQSSPKGKQSMKQKRLYDRSSSVERTRRHKYHKKHYQRSSSRSPNVKRSNQHRKKRGRSRPRSHSRDRERRSSDLKKHGPKRFFCKDKNHTKTAMNSEFSNITNIDQNLDDVDMNLLKDYSCDSKPNYANRTDNVINSNSSHSLSGSSKKIEIKISSAARKDSKICTDTNNKTDLIGKWEPVEKQSLKALTEFCKKLAEDKDDKNPKEGAETVSMKETETVQVEDTARHPFSVKPAPPIPPIMMLPMVPMNPAQAIQAGKIQQVVGTLGAVPVLPKEIQASFPVSSGLQHRAKENADHLPNAPVFEAESKPVNISAIIADRLQAQTAINENPFNIEAIAKLKGCDEMIKTWSKSNVKPEQFTGEKTKNILSKEELEGGYSAWARKDFFTNLQPIREGIGLRLLQKMGWTYGQPLGKNRAGFVNPLAFEIRFDRRGLSTPEENANKLKAKRKGPPVIDIKGKHPVSALSEYCTKRRWTLPDYKLVLDSGLAHSKNYLFRVTINGQDYTPPSPSPNKKNAKAQAATAALQKLGLLT